MEKNERLGLKEFVEKYAEHNNIPKSKSHEEVTRFLETLKTVVKNGNGVSLYGIGNIDVFTLPPSDVRNPLTGSTVFKPERNKVKFKFSTTFKKEIE